MAKHTAAPWEVFTEDGFSGWWAIRQAESGYEVGSGDGGFYEADARLIAAAPELLALLVESQESIGGDWRKRRDALIAKATGQCLKGEE